MCFKQAWTVTMAGYWGKMERIVCSYQPLRGSQIAWWGRIIKNEQNENKIRATWERARWREKQADLATGRERQLTTGKRAERTKHDFRCSIYRSAIGHASRFSGRKRGFASNLLSANMMQICANWVPPLLRFISQFAQI